MNSADAPRISNVAPGFFAAFDAPVVVCLVACVEPTRRALRVEPTEALRTE